MKQYKLTEYSHGAGCGCKISPQILSKIIGKKNNQISFPNLLVGNDTRDDAAVIDLENGTAIVSTTDFFMPIVDDAEDFGRISAANAISDIYAMGATPIMAIAILGWTLDKLPPELARLVLEGGQSICHQAKIPLAGGHSIDSPEPIFGLSVTGKVKITNIKRNSDAKKGDLLYLTKPLGVGIFTTAEKKGKIKKHDIDIAKKSMLKLNSIGEKIGQYNFVNAMTDVTGFGLLGHLNEVCIASGVSAIVNFEKVPLLNKKAMDYYINNNCIPGGTKRNWESYSNDIDVISEYQKQILCDPQTSGGLLITVERSAKAKFEQIARNNNLELNPLGEIISNEQKNIFIQ